MTGPQSTLEELLERLPGVGAEPPAGPECVLLAGGRRLATARFDGEALVVELPISANLRESLEAAGLAAVLPRGRRATWRIPPDDLDEAVAVLRAAQVAV